MMSPARSPAPRDVRPEVQTLSWDSPGKNSVEIVEKEAYGSNKLDAFINRHFGKSYMKVVSAFVREEKVTEEELAEFLKNLKKD